MDSDMTRINFEQTTEENIVRYYRNSQTRCKRRSRALKEKLLEVSSNLEVFLQRCCY